MGRDQQGRFLQPWGQQGIGLGRRLAGSGWCRWRGRTGAGLGASRHQVRFIAIQLHAAAAGLRVDLGHKGGDIATAGNQRHQLRLQPLGLKMAPLGPLDLAPKLGNALGQRREPDHLGLVLPQLLPTGQHQKHTHAEGRHTAHEGRHPPQHQLPGQELLKARLGFLGLEVGHFSTPAA